MTDRLTGLSINSESERRLTMRSSEPAPLERPLLSHPATFAHPAAQRSRQLRRSLSLRSLFGSFAPGAIGETIVESVVAVARSVYGAYSPSTS